ncbi:MAG: hypothetical protein COV76_03160 [Candidatus Omnitrophica bacterium CG11_big_fil_rev_8_21_14_0_20_64_10]|nr:MAG: hypothetical protein COV76_03160 [Candidatus Omnitrophica bacterium CG11_big_fil_rev_8_21_14_0_20_64_10]
MVRVSWAGWNRRGGVIPALRRIVAGGGLLAGVAWVIFGAPVWVFAAVTTALVWGGLREFFAMVARKGIQIERVIGYAVGLSIPLSIYASFEPTKGWELFFITGAFLTIFTLQLTRRESSQAIVGISTALFGIFYISWCFSFLIKLRFLEGPGLPGGAWLVAFLIGVTKGGDIGAYGIGSLIGKHALIRRISPSKTWEGTIGGLLVSVLVALLFRPVLPAVSLQELVGLGLLLGAVGQIGDLSESLIKRDCQVKDSGRFLPGLGGVLDVLDSLLFSAPVFYFFVQHFWTG